MDPEPSAVVPKGGAPYRSLTTALKELKVEAKRFGAVLTLDRIGLPTCRSPSTAALRLVL